MKSLIFWGLLGMLSILCGSAASAEQVSPPPLTAEQLSQIRALVQKTQAEQSRFKAVLAEAQEKLAKCYSSYELDEPQVLKLEQKILEHQKSLLASHHAMQKELRALVGPERFKILSRRIENVLKTPKPQQMTNDK